MPSGLSLARQQDTMVAPEPTMAQLLVVGPRTLVGTIKDLNRHKAMTVTTSITRHTLEVPGVSSQDKPKGTHRSLGIAIISSRMTIGSGECDWLTMYIRLPVGCTDQMTDGPEPWSAIQLLPSS